MIPIWAQWVGVVALVMLVAFRSVDFAAFVVAYVRARRKRRLMREFEAELHARVSEAAQSMAEERKQAERELN